MTLRAVALMLLALTLGPSAAFAGSDTYCVGVPGPFFTNGVCGSDAIRSQHARWHFHTYVSEGQHCYQCFDERDNTCETDFLRNHPEWMPISGSSCGVLGRAPQEEGVKFHVIDGEDVTSQLNPSAPKGVTVTTEVTPQGRGPYAVGGVVRFDVETRIAPDQLRPFQGGELVLSDVDTGEEVARVPVDGGTDGKGEVSVALPRAGRLRATLEVGTVGLPGTEMESTRDAVHWVLRVGGCVLGTIVEGPAGALLLGGDDLALVGRVVDNKGVTLPASSLDGQNPRFLLTREDGTEVGVVATMDGDRLAGTLVMPELASGTEVARVQLVTDADTTCPGEALEVTLSHSPLTLAPSVPEVCWTGRPCVMRFELGRPTGAAARARADELLADQGLEVLARLGGQRVMASRTGDNFTITTTPDSEGRLHTEVELLWSGDRSLRAEASVEVRESIELVLPEDVDLGTVSGGTSPEDTCVPLSFSAGRGTLGSRFSVTLEGEPCEGCEAEVVAVVSGQAYDLPLDEVVIGRDQEIPICLRVSRCPTGPDGGEASLVVTPLEPLFADQVRRVRVSYAVQPRGLLDCWGWMLRWLLGGLGMFAIGYGFLRPVGFEPGTSVRMASSDKNLRRASRVLLEEQRGGKKGWYRSACVHVDAGGAPTGRRREALFTFVPYAGGVALRSSAGVERQNRRTRKMEPAPADGPGGSVPLARGRLYAVGDILIKVGG